MSKPIMEGTTARDISRSKFGHAQLMRRPSVSDLGTCPVPWALMYATAEIDVADNTGVILTGGTDIEVETQTSLVIDVRTSGGVKYFRYWELGVYEFFISMTFDANFSGEWEIHANVFDPSTVLGGVAFYVNAIETESRGETFRRASLSNSVVFDSFPSLPSFNGLAAAVFNNSGAQRTITNFVFVTYQIAEFQVS